MKEVNKIDLHEFGQPKKHPKCEGFWTYNSNAHEFDCRYGSVLTCEECKFGVCGGDKDPRAKKNQPK